MQRSDEKLFLQWNDFRDNICSAFGKLKDDKDFTDVTLACEDGQQVEAHKVVLISSSPFFLNLLKRNQHPHPLVYMRGLKYENLLSMVDFLYHGEANVYQENLDSFLAMADDLRLKGLDQNREEGLKEVLSSKTHNNLFTTFKEKTSSSQRLKNKIVLSLPSETAIKALDDDPFLFPTSGNLTAKQDWLNDPPANTDIAELDEKVKSLMSYSENLIGKDRKSRARICNVCGKEGQTINIKHHIEANHMTNISIPCNACGKISSSRNALNSHKRICKFQPGFLSQ